MFKEAKGAPDVTYLCLELLENDTLLAKLSLLVHAPMGTEGLFSYICVCSVRQEDTLGQVKRKGSHYKSIHMYFNYIFIFAI